MSRIKPEQLPSPKRVSKSRAQNLYRTFSATGTSKYDRYVDAATSLTAGESLDVLELPENVITSIQKKFREKGLVPAKGYYAISKTLGTEQKGNKSLLIGRYASIPKAAPKKKTAPAKPRAVKTKAAESAPAAAPKKTTAKPATAKPATAKPATAKPATAKKATATTRRKKVATPKARKNGAAVTA